MKLAIVGSRSIDDYEYVSNCVEWLINQTGQQLTLIVSGGATGVDSLAERYASEHGIEIMIFKPDYKKHGRAAPFIRNKTIVENCDILLAVWDGVSKGTLDSIKHAERLGKGLSIFEYGQLRLDV